MKIAILIPTYNASKTVKQTLISVQQNIHENNHLNTVAIVCDDNSQDNTLEIVENSWYLHRSLLEIIPSNKNQGERENINRILKNVENNYDWFYIIHADDIAKEDWLSTIYHYSLLYKDAASIATSYDVLHLDGSIEIGENKEEVTMIRGNLTSIKSTL
ncbi:MAG TPA: glycosyltransferase family A protein, partial [Flavobacterium sp.]|nr:glycosyltransferase family A protein [Flavobacterium sp.]